MVRILRRHIRVFHNKYGGIRPGGVGVPCTPSDIINNTGFQFHRPDGAGSFISAITDIQRAASFQQHKYFIRGIVSLHILHVFQVELWGVIQICHPPALKINLRMIAGILTAFDLQKLFIHGIRLLVSHITNW